MTEDKANLRRRVARGAGTAMAAALAVGLCSCPGQGPTDDSPQGALKLFMVAMKRHDREAAFKLLAPESQDILADRAKNASDQAGREIKADQMLVVERFVMRWEIKNATEQVDGDRCTLKVRGHEAGQAADVQLVRVDQSWRIVLPR